jgi:hypothetical protein
MGMRQHILCSHCRQSFPVWPYELRNGRRFCSTDCQTASRRNTKEGFWQLVSRPQGTDCWIWTGRMNAGGYGVYPYKGETLAHRVSYLLTHGPIPAGRCLDHTCRTRPCVNPAHVEPTTWRENILRGEGIAAREATATHCKWGHPFDEKNTVVRRDGGRFCRACGRRRYNEYTARKKASGEQPR